MDIITQGFIKETFDLNLSELVEDRIITRDQMDQMINTMLLIAFSHRFNKNDQFMNEL